MLYLFIYAFTGWVIEVIAFALYHRRFINRGFLNLPFNIPCGLTAVILMQALPTLEHNYILQYLLCILVYKTVHRFADQFVQNRRHGIAYREAANYSPAFAQLLSLLVAGAMLVGYLIVHPFVMGLMLFIPEWLKAALSLTLGIVTLADYLTVRYALYTYGAAKRRLETQNLGRHITDGVWKRLERAYPSIKRTAHPVGLVFAHGICTDKLVWVFLVSSFLGALIEMVYCRAVGDIWMNRSSVLYGPFSFVWGFGAVVLTVVLQRFAGKADRWVFLAGFLVGGAYEYLCSVFTELVFGTVFWDYSHMPLNISGRTNVLFCFFWGVLAVIWIKILYPPMERAIERIPPLTGKIITWLIILLMALNGLLTAGAMLRYTQQQSKNAEANIIEHFFDTRYDDAYMEHRWPNMVVTKSE